MSGQCRRVLVRADAGPRLGAGHVMRCLALAQTLRDADVRVTLVSAELPESLRERWQAESVATELLAVDAGSSADAEATVAAAHRAAADWTILDGYHFDAQYQRTLKNAGPSLLLIDDHGHAQDYCADIIVDQNVNASATLYPRRPASTRLLLGICHALLRREFLGAARSSGPVPRRARRILVTLGGADPDNVTLKVLRGLARLADQAEIMVVVGASHRHRAALEAEARSWPRSPHIQVDVPNMAERMAWADLAISGAGGTSWELAFMGVPNVSLILADNQVEVARSVEAEGIGVSLGWHHAVTESQIADTVLTLMNDPERRQRMHERGPRLVDGQGGRRVFRAMAGEEIGT
jgi:UDP-2,4-diacetamido-2,4,6-trideoxy-beta-L-altropyranose hydrolase